MEWVLMSIYVLICLWTLFCLIYLGLHYRAERHEDIVWDTAENVQQAKDFRNVVVVDYL